MHDIFPWIRTIGVGARRAARVATVGIAILGLARLAIMETVAPLRADVPLFRDVPTEPIMTLAGEGVARLGPRRYVGVIGGSVWATVRAPRGRAFAKVVWRVVGADGESDGAIHHYVMTIHESYVVRLGVVEHRFVNAATREDKIHFYLDEHPTVHDVIAEITFDDGSPTRTVRIGL